MTNPFEEIERLMNRMSSQFEGLEEDVFGARLPVDIEDTGDSFVVTADFPGYSAEDIDVSLSGETLRITAEHSKSEEETGDYIRRERRKRSSSRSIRLPEPVNEDETNAAYNQGVLTITLQKQDTDNGRSIPVT